jgi:hypothetical protein
MNRLVIIIISISKHVIIILYIITCSNEGPHGRSTALTISTSNLFRITLCSALTSFSRSIAKISVFSNNEVQVTLAIVLIVDRIGMVLVADFFTTASFAVFTTEVDRDTGVDAGTLLVNAVSSVTSSGRSAVLDIIDATEPRRGLSDNGSSN